MTRALSEDFFGRLDGAVVGEAEALEELRKAGASEEDIDAATWAFRLLASLPEPVAKALGTSEIESQSVEKSAEYRARMAEDARRTNERIQRHAREAALRKAEARSPTS